MAIYYSASAAGFFDDAIHAALPADAVAITAKRHHNLLAAQATGALIEAGEEGKPRIRRLVTSLTERRAALVAKVKREATQRIEAVSPIWRQLNDQRALTDEGMARFAAIDAIRVASEQIEAEIDMADKAALNELDIAAHPAWPA